MNIQMKYIPPPRLKYVEQAVIGKLMLGKTLEILPRVYPEDFYTHDMRKLYELIQAHFYEFGSVSKSLIYDKAENLDLTTKEQIDTFEAIAIDEDTEAIALELKDYRRKREQHIGLIKGLDLITKDATSRQIYDHILSNMTQWGGELELTAHNLPEIAERIEAGEIGKRLNIGNALLDNIFATVGSHTGTTEVCVAHPKHGKTTYACWRAAQYLNSGYKGLYFTFEGNEEDVYNVIKPMVENGHENLYVIDNCQTAEEAAAKIYQFKSAKDIDFVVIDYVQRIGAAGVRYSEETSRISQVSYILTNMIREQKVYGLLLAQPRKLSDDRKLWRSCPTVDDVYGSGQVFKDAYLVTSIFRPFLSPAGQLYNSIRDGWGTMDSMGRIVPSNSVFLKMLICRRGLLDTMPIQFIHNDKGLTQTEKIYDNNGNWNAKN